MGLKPATPRRMVLPAAGLGRAYGDLKEAPPGDWMNLAHVQALLLGI